MNLYNIAKKTDTVQTRHEPKFYASSPYSTRRHFFLPWCKKKKGRKRRRRDRRGRKEEGERRSGGSSWPVEDNPKKDYPPRFEAAPTDPRRISRLKHQTPRGKKGRRRSKQTRPGRQEGERKKKRGEAPYQNNLLASADCHSNASCCPAQLYLFFLGAALPCRLRGKPIQNQSAS